MSYLEIIFTGILPWAYLALFMMSLGVNAISVALFKRRPVRSRCLEDLTAVQAMHVDPTPRVGGLSLVFCTLALCPLLDVKLTNVALCIICITPAVATGFMEDFGYHLRPHWRLAAAAASGALAIHFFDLLINRTGIAPLDAVLTFTPAAIAFTIFATTGVVNAFNLIDGLNGLATLTAIGTSISLSIVAHSSGQSQLAQMLFFFTPILLGFLSLNYPFGKVFLGDGGAYLLGFTLACFAVFILQSNKAISPFAILLIFFWPVADTLLAIWRRARKGKSSTRPDSLHFHQIAMCQLQLKAHMPKRLANPVTTLILLPMILLPQAVGVLTLDNFKLSLAATFFFCVAFLASYKLLSRWANIRTNRSRRLDKLETT